MLGRSQRQVNRSCEPYGAVTGFYGLTNCVDWREAELTEENEMIKKVKGGYKVLSESGKNLGGPYKSKAQAEKRLRQVEFFKHKKG